MKLNESELENSIRKFSKETIEKFSFLDSEYGFKRYDLEREGFEFHLIDAMVFIRYFSKKISVEIFWAIGDGVLSVGLYELSNGDIPEKVSFYGHEGYGRAINLDSLIRMSTDEKVKPPIPRDIIKATKMILSNMGDIVGIYAERLREYAHDILLGDTSIFPKVQEYHRKYWDVEL